jgi:hypothetical protein
MSEVRPESLRKHLPKPYQERVELVGVNGLGGEADSGKELKEYGYPKRLADKLLEEIKQRGFF